MFRQHLTLRMAALFSLVVSSVVVPHFMAGAQTPSVPNQINPNILRQNEPRILTVNCTSTGQNCDRTASLTIYNNFDAPGEFVLYLTAPASHCSNVNYFITDRNGQRRETGFLTPGRREMLYIGRLDARSRYTVQIGAIGQTGGCNSGRLGSWSVEAFGDLMPPG